LLKYMTDRPKTLVSVGVHIAGCFPFSLISFKSEVYGACAFGLCLNYQVGDVFLQLFIYIAVLGAHAAYMLLGRILTVLI
jgi:hypothetical protein